MFCTGRRLLLAIINDTHTRQGRKVVIWKSQSSKSPETTQNYRTGHPVWNVNLWLDYETFSSAKRQAPLGHGIVIDPTRHIYRPFPNYLIPSRLRWCFVNYNSCKKSIPVAPADFTLNHIVSGSLNFSVSKISGVCFSRIYSLDRLLFAPLFMNCNRGN